MVPPLYLLFFFLVKEGLASLKLDPDIEVNCTLSYDAESVNSTFSLDLFFRNHLRQLQKTRHPAVGLGYPRVHARGYITMMFKKYGLSVTEHYFTTYVTFLDEGRHIEKEVVGYNIVGVARGRSTPGEVVLVGADYDTGRDSNPLRNNGAGVALLLEAARGFMNLTTFGNFRRNETVLFAAFDLNTRKHVKPRSHGKPGSRLFVEQWLSPFLARTRSHLAGALILDSVTKFTSFPGSQVLPEGFNELQGFLPFDLLDISYRDGASLTESIRMFSRQSHFHFWTNEHPLPAILLTDTDDYRTLQGRDSCERMCTWKTFLSEDTEIILETITRTLILVLIRSQATFDVPPEQKISQLGATFSHSRQLCLSVLPLGLALLTLEYSRWSRRGGQLFFKY